MRYGAHLPLIDFDGHGWNGTTLQSYARLARESGYQSLTANDHLVFSRPWLDGIVALASVIEASGQLDLATSVSLPVVRGPAALAKAAAALDVLSGGRFILGIGPGSSQRDYELAGVPFTERWPRFDEAVRALRSHLTADAQPSPSQYYANGPELEPGPQRPEGPPIWIASWGSAAGLRRVARLGDGWLASAYNTTPDQVAAARATIATLLERAGRPVAGFSCALATMWTYITDDRGLRETHLEQLGAMLKRPVADLAQHLLVGTAEHCAAIVRAYQAAGVDHLFIWPLAENEAQLVRFMREVAPLV